MKARKNNADIVTKDEISPLFDNKSWFPIGKLYLEAIDLYLNLQFWSCIVLSFDIIELSLRLCFFLETEKGSKKYTEGKVRNMKAKALIDEAVVVNYISQSVAQKLHRVRKKRNSLTHYQSYVEIGNENDSKYLEESMAEIITRIYAQISGPTSKEALEKIGFETEREFLPFFNQVLKDIAKESFNAMTELLLVLFPVPK